MQGTETGTTMAAKAATPVAVAAANHFGMSLPDVIQWGTAIYIGLMVIHKLWHMWMEFRTGKRAPESEGDLL